MTTKADILASLATMHDDMTTTINAVPPACGSGPAYLTYALIVHDEIVALIAYVNANM